MVDELEPDVNSTPHLTYIDDESDATTDEPPRSVEGSDEAPLAKGEEAYEKPANDIQVLVLAAELEPNQVGAAFCAAVVKEVVPEVTIEVTPAAEIDRNSDCSSPPTPIGETSNETPDKEQEEVTVTVDFASEDNEFHCTSSRLEDHIPEPSCVEQVKVAHEIYEIHQVVAKRPEENSCELNVSAHSQQLTAAAEVSASEEEPHQVHESPTKAASEELERSAPAESVCHTPIQNADSVPNEEKSLQQTSVAEMSPTLTPAKPPHGHYVEGASAASEAVVFRQTMASAPPTPPPRRNSTVADLPPGTPTPTVRSLMRQTSVASSRTNTLNYSLARGRLSFPTLPRNARPPTRGEHLWELILSISYSFGRIFWRFNLKNQKRP